MKRRLVMMFCWLVLAGAGTLHAEEARPEGTAAFSVGGAGLLSRGAHSGVIVPDLEAGVRLPWRVEIMLAYRLKISPLNGNAYSLFHAWLALGRVEVWRGLFVEAGAGPAMSYLKLDQAQEFGSGGSWLIGAGYTWRFVPFAAVRATAFVQQYYLRQLYTQPGAEAGLAFYF